MKACKDGHKFYEMEGYQYPTIFCSRCGEFRVLEENNDTMKMGFIPTVETKPTPETGDE